MRWKIAILGIVLTILSPISDHHASYAQAETIVSVDLFYQELSPLGAWSPHPEFGYVWQPYNIGPQWKPYTDGRWEWSDQGWLWISYEPWGWATYHYGRWICDDYSGWIWIPGTTWAPAWVSWQESPEYIGWSPLPPDRRFFIEIGFVFNSYKPYYKPYRYKHHHKHHYGYRHKKHRYYHDYYHDPHNYKPPRKHCVYMPYHKFGDHKHVASEVVPPKYAIDLRNQRHVTNIKRVNNKVYNYGPSKYAVEKRSKRKLVRHKIEDKYTIQTRGKHNINHINGKSYKVYRPKIDRGGKDPFTTNRNSNNKHGRSSHYSKHKQIYKKDNRVSNPKTFNTQTTRLKSSQATGSYQAAPKAGYSPKRGEYESYSYKTRQHKLKPAQAYNQNGSGRVNQNRAYGKTLTTVNRNTQKPISYSKPKYGKSYKAFNKSKSRSYSNNKKSYSNKTRVQKQRPYKTRSGNVPTSQRNRFSRY